MKAFLQSLIAGTSNPTQARNQVREYLQALILQSLQRAGAMVPLAFLGGTALRFLYQIERYSEDLDFSLEGDPEPYDFASYLQAIQRDLQAQGYNVTLRHSDARVVHSAFLRFPGLLFDLELSPHQDKALSLKLEVDTRPPAGAVLQTSLVRRHVLLNLQHYDPASLFAGKIHALLQRPYLKGRDLYDLFWYLGDPDWPEPNLTFLNAALRQTGWSEPRLTQETWRSVLFAHLAGINWAQAHADVQPFLQDQAELTLLTPENLRNLLTR